MMRVWYARRDPASRNDRFTAGVSAAAWRRVPMNTSAAIEPGFPRATLPMSVAVSIARNRLMRVFPESEAPDAKRERAGGDGRQVGQTYQRVRAILSASSV